jgi:hypothetical protein
MIGVSMQGTDTKRIEPIMLVHDDGSRVYRVYMHVHDGIYSVYLGDGVTRMFTDETLPDAIKVIVGLINAYTWSDERVDSSLEIPNVESILFRFKPNYPAHMFDIGWRSGPHYCLVLPEGVMKNLLGDLTVSEGQA